MSNIQKQTEKPTIEELINTVKKHKELTLKNNNSVEQEQKSNELSITLRDNNITYTEDWIIICKEPKEFELGYSWKLILY